MRMWKFLSAILISFSCLTFQVMASDQANASKLFTKWKRSLIADSSESAQTLALLKIGTEVCFSEGSKADYLDALKQLESFVENLRLNRHMTKGTFELATKNFDRWKETLERG